VGRTLAGMVWRTLAGLTAFLFLLLVATGCGSLSVLDPGNVPTVPPEESPPPDIHRTVAAAVRSTIQAAPTQIPDAVPTSTPVPTTPPTQEPAAAAIPGEVSTPVPEPTAPPVPVTGQTLLPAASPVPVVAPTPLPTAEPKATPAPTATPAPLPAPSPTPTSEPAATPTATASGSIPSLEARVTDLRFFESGATSVPREDRVYRQIFDQEATRSVDWELTLAHPPPGAQIYEFTVEAVYHRPDGSVLGRSTHEGRIEGDSTISWSTSSFGGFGTGRTGGWPLGAYRVDLLVEGGLIASSGFVVEDRPNVEPTAFIELRDGLPWATGRLTYENRRDLKTLSTLARNHPNLAATVAAFPWVVAGVTDHARVALEYLALLADQDPALATRLAALPWVADDITKPEAITLKYLTMLSGRDGPLAHTVAALPWAQNQVSPQDGTALEYLYFFTTESPAIAHIVAGYPWFAVREVKSTSVCPQ